MDVKNAGIAIAECEDHWDMRADVPDDSAAEPVRSGSFAGMLAHPIRISHGTPLVVRIEQEVERIGIGPPKSASSMRTIPLGPAAVGALKVWKLACPKGELDLVFPSGRRAVVLHHKTLARQFESLVKAAKLTDKKDDARYGLHSLQHYFASSCINPRDRGGRGLPAKVVQELMGHSTITLTMDRYGHLFPRGDDREELAAAEQALLG
jgi:integrase